jgi:hypothetical protein
MKKGRPENSLYLRYVLSPQNPERKDYPKVTSPRIDGM